MESHPLPTSLSSLGTSAEDAHDILIIIEALEQVCNTLRSDASKRVYRQDTQAFLVWLLHNEDGITLQHLEYHHLGRYQQYLRREHSNITVNRMMTVARRLIAELIDMKAIETNCLNKSIRPLPTEDETTHVALSKEQALRLLALIDTSTIRGKRDYAIVQLLMRTGLRRAECQGLNMGSIGMEQAHYVARITGKGDKPARVKIPPDVWRYIEEYNEALEQAHPRRDKGLDAPLFLSMRKGDIPIIDTESCKERRIDAKTIENMIKDLGRRIGIPDSEPLTPHGLRATFATFAFEEGVPLVKVQYAMRHKDPRTTERYQKRKMNLDDNAVDKLNFLARGE